MPSTMRSMTRSQPSRACVLRRSRPMILLRASTTPICMLVPPRSMPMTSDERDERTVCLLMRGTIPQPERSILHPATTAWPQCRCQIRLVRIAAAVDTDRQPSDNPPNSLGARSEKRCLSPVVRKRTDDLQKLKLCIGRSPFDRERIKHCHDGESALGFDYNSDGNVGGIVTIQNAHRVGENPGQGVVPNLLIQNEP